MFGRFQNHAIDGRARMKRKAADDAGRIAAYRTSAEERKPAAQAKRDRKNAKRARDAGHQVQPS